MLKVLPKVTETSIQAKIASVEYVELVEAVICQIGMKNGFVFIGSGETEGKAYRNAFDQIWSHENYLMREKLHG